MQPPSLEGYEITVRDGWEYASPKDSNQTSYNRLKGSKDWIAIDPSKKFSLILVRENQPEPEPDLWSLFVTRAKGEIGSVYCVRGDVVNMHFEATHDVNPLESALLKDAHIIAMLTEEEAQAVRHFSGLEAPPSAPDRASATENCQGWTARLLERLAAEGVLSGQKLEPIRAIVDPVR